MEPESSDIPTTRPARHRARREEEQRLAWIVESSQDMIIGLTLDGVITSWNRAAERAFGYSAAEAVGQQVDLVVPPEKLSELAAVLERLNAGEEIDWFETIARAKHGRNLEVSIAISPIRDITGHVVGASVIARDITASIQIERELERERTAAHQYLDIAGTMFVVISADETVQLVNQKGCEILGYSEAEILGTNWFDLVVPPADRETIRSVFSQLMRGELAPFEFFENTILTRGGVERTIAWNTALVRDGAGQITGVVSSGEDVTERRVMERALRDSERQFRRAILESPFPAMLHAEDGTIVEVSRAWTEILGFAREQMPTIDDWLALAFRGRAADMRSWVRDLFTLKERTNGGEFLIETAFGQRRVWEFFSSPVGIDPLGRRMVMTGANDLTERRLLEREIIEISEQERRRIGRDLHDGLASHLSGIAMMSRGLANEASSGRLVGVEELEEIAALAREGAEQARALAQGLSPVTLEAAGLGAALQDLAIRSEHQSGIRCRFSAPSNSPILTTEVVSQLYWIARESVTNAIKHSGASEISIDLCHCPQSISLQIRDDGRGLPEEVSGSGLGIHIMRYRANMIGARLRLEARGHRGVVVTCVIGDVEDPDCRHNQRRSTP